MCLKAYICPTRVVPALIAGNYEATGMCEDAPLYCGATPLFITALNGEKCSDFVHALSFNGDGIREQKGIANPVFV